jgi:hypothetical protein
LVVWVAKAARNGNDVATDGTVDGKNGKDFDGLRAAGEALHAARSRHEGGGEWRVCGWMRLFKVLAARDGAAVVELNYHRQGEMSRGWMSDEAGRFTR